MHPIFHRAGLDGASRQSEREREIRVKGGGLLGLFPHASAKSVLYHAEKEGMQERASDHNFAARLCFFLSVLITEECGSR